MPKTITIALAGNPNAGKTSLFNQLTGAHAHVGNYPGVTVEKREGVFHQGGREVRVVDLPGTYSLTAYSLEERVARNYILEERPDLVVDVVDAANLDRNLYLTLQFMEIGVPVVIALNMMDVAEARGLKIDVAKLEVLLGAPVVPTVARGRKGLEALKNVVVRTAGRVGWKQTILRYGPDLDLKISEIAEIISQTDLKADNLPPRWLALKALENDSQIKDLLAQDEKTLGRIMDLVEEVTRHIRATLEDEPEGVIADHRYGYITSVTKQVVAAAGDFRRTISDLVDLAALNRLVGPLILIAVLYGLYQMIFWLSQAPVAWSEAFFAWMSALVRGALNEGPLRSLLTSGVIDGVGGVLSFVPLIALMFFGIAVLEDSGYLARIAFIMDRVLRTFGLHGNSVLALMVGGGISGGCAVPGVLAARTLRDRKERLATILVTPFMNCGAKLPIFSVLIAAFFARHQARLMFLLTLLAWAFALVSARVLRWTMLRGRHTPFVMELPPYRLPTLKGLLIHTWERVWQYLKKAGTVILAISILMWALMTFPGPPRELTVVFQHQRGQVLTELFSGPAGRILPDEQVYSAFARYLAGRSEQGPGQVKAGEEGFEALSRAIAALRAGAVLPENLAGFETPARAYLAAADKIRTLDSAEANAALRHSLAGRLGTALEPLTRPLGFDWRTNIALVGGLAAKEVVVSSLGTAYSLGQTDPQGGDSLAARLSAEPGWNKLAAFTLMLFVMLYSPCGITLVTIGREAGWRWSLFAMIYTTILAYLVSLMVASAGRALGLGL
ncbi:MAG: ferrous iron transport protein B [Thermodesulfobacteriota bacterium]